MGSFSSLAAGIKPVLNFEVEGSSGAVNDMETIMVQKFWDSALVISGANAAAISCSESAFMASDSIEPGKSYPFLGLGNSFAFKFEDHKGCVHLLNRYDEGNKVLLTTDSDLAGAISHARTTGLKGIAFYKKLDCLVIVGTTGIVDYTNNDEMKYVVDCQIQEGKLEIEPGNLDWHVLPMMRSNFGFAFDEVGLLKRIQNGKNQGVAG
ncbi:hypothetical protein C5167_008165 [Papaver somniferum]|uniref:Uncharacterized protein n=1 Tax=Papaver somniferum TaxID=3469 RepID=A0A4Y7JXP7_PAPSO|nr:hypothetical protein C5167_008165 [Papaver somniferum]